MAIGYTYWCQVQSGEADRHHARSRNLATVLFFWEPWIKQSTAWLLPHKLRESWRTPTGSNPMSGPVEMDEVYLGGREKNKHASKKRKSDKAAVVGIKDRSTRTRARQVCQKLPRPVLSTSLSPILSRAQGVH